MATKVLSKFETLLKELCEVEVIASLVGATSPPGKGTSDWQQGWAYRKLSVQGFRDEAVINAGGKEKIVALHKALISSRPDEFPLSRRFIGRATRADPTNLLSVTVREPPSSPDNSTMRYWTRDINVQAELSERGFTLMALVGVAVWIATEQSPERFGIVDSLAQRERAYADAKTRLAALRARVAKEYTPDDLVDLEARADGSVVQAMRISDGAVGVGPVSSLGERLGRFLLTSTAAQKYLGVQVP